MPRLIPLLAPADKALFVASARMLLTAGKKGAPVEFRHTGRNTKGVDCIGVPIWAYASLGLGCFVQDLDRYSRAPDGKTLREALQAHLGDPIPLAQAEPGDVALMRWYGGTNYVNHVGVITAYPFGGLALLHSFLSMRKVVEHRIDPVWRRRIVEVYRV